MADFVDQSNPVAVFIREELANEVGELERKDLYVRYVNWTKTAGHETLSRTKFTRKFRDTLKQIRPDVVEKRTDYGRYFVFQITQEAEPDKQIDISSVPDIWDLDKDDD